MNPLALSVTEAHQTLGISRRKLYELINDGTIRTIKVGARRLVPMAELDRFVNGRAA
jgi:excisionase family DNA binding protein